MHLIPLSLNGGVTNGEYIETLSKNGVSPIWENSWSKGVSPHQKKTRFHEEQLNVINHNSKPHQKSYDDMC